MDRVQLDKLSVDILDNICNHRLAHVQSHVQIHLLLVHFFRR